MLPLKVPCEGTGTYTQRTQTSSTHRSATALALRILPTSGTFARVEAERLGEEQFEDWTVEQYVYHSITAPNEYVVDGYTAGVMPMTFGTTLTDQDLADLIAFIATQ